jgi:20S proteasome alpha/beta subunit
MTAIVGILCEEGVVLGTDSSATFGAGGIRTIEQPYDKLHVIGGSVAVAGSGPVGMGQRFEAIVKEA